MTTPPGNKTPFGRKLGTELLSRGGDRLARLDRRPFAHRLLVRALPLAIVRMFDPEAAGDLTATFELRVRDPEALEPTCFELRVSGRCCEAHPGPARDPQLTASIGADDMIRLVSGSTGWPDLLAAGRLELTGDPFLGLRFPKLFKLPAAPTNRNPISTPVVGPKTS